MYLRAVEHQASGVRRPFAEPHHASRVFLESMRKEGLCRNRVKSLLSMRKPLLGDSFKPRPSLDRTPRRQTDFRTEG